MIATYGVDDARVVTDETLIIWNSRSHSGGLEAVCGDGSLAKSAPSKSTYAFVEALLAL